MADEKDRKTLEERHQMSDLERLRHSCAHVLATAVSRIWPDAQFAAGPPVEGGFYYDVDLKLNRLKQLKKIKGNFKGEFKGKHEREIK